MKKITSALFLFIVLSVSAFAQNGKIVGKIIDKATGDDIIGASVVVKGTTKGAQTDIEGHYKIDVAPGIYTLVISYVAYKTVEIKGVTVVDGKTVTIDAAIEEQGVVGEEIVVETEAKKTTVNSLLITQKNAPSVSDGISNETIKTTPDRSTSDVMRRVSGASIQDNRFAIIRGLNERYNAAYINGAPLPSSESDRKAFSFDIFPSNLLDNLTIIKTATPDMPGEFAGGIIQINTRSIPDENFNTVSVTGGYNTITTFKDRVAYHGGKFDWLGIDDGTRALPKEIPTDQNYPTARPDQANLGKLIKNDWGTLNKKFAPNLGFQYSGGHVWKSKKKESRQLGAIYALTYNRNSTYSTTLRKQYDSNDDPTIPVQITEDYTDQNYQTQTLAGAMANFAFNINTNNQIGFKNLYSINSDDRVIVRNGTSTPLDNNPTLNRNTAYWFTSNRIYTGQLNGLHNLGKSGVKVNWIGSYSSVIRDIPDLRRNSFVRNKYVSNDATDTLYKANVSIANVGPDYAGNIFYGKTKESIYSVKGDANYNFNFKLDSGFTVKNEIKIGGLYQHRSRDFEARQLGFIKNAPAGGMPFADSLLYLSAGQVFAPQNMGQIDPGHGGFILANKYKPTDSYSAESNLGAAFVMLDHRIGSMIRLIWGARMENFTQILYTTLDNKQPLNIETHKTDILPSANLVVSLTERKNVRLSYSKTVNRPEFRELAPFAFYDFATRFVVSGNSTLTRALIKNYDARYEYYPGRGQVFSVTGFYKQFDNPIEQVARPDVTGEITYKNVTKANNYGVELEFRTLMSSVLGTKSQGFWDFVTVYTNVALIKSKVDVTGVTGVSGTSRPLQGQSPYIINAGILYNNIDKGFSVAVNYNKVGQRIAIVGTTNEPDIWENGRHIIDLQVGKSFLKDNKLDVRLNVKDLLAQKLYFFQDRNHNKKFDNGYDNQIWVTNFGPTISAIVAYKF